MSLPRHFLPSITRCTLAVQTQTFMNFRLLLALLVLFSVVACRRWDDFETSPMALLEFSTDTLRFDTVFTELGSATRYFKVINPHSKPIKISKISLINNEFAVFNLNVDGIAGHVFENIEVPAKDSIYVFAEVTINPDNPLSASPFVIGSEVSFETNGNAQSVKLECYGQNANYIPFIGAEDQFALLTTDQTWSDDKPYVIYGILFVDSCTLTLPAGCDVYIHGGLSKLNDTTVYNDGGLFILSEGHLNILGTADNPVTIQSDRLEPEFADVSGQYWGIQLAAGSTSNIIEYAHIRHGLVGVYVDSAAELTIKNTEIHATSSSGIFARHAKVTGSNCLIYDNGGQGLRTEFGGDYQFDYMTVASYSNSSPALRIGNVQCYDADCIIYLINPMKFRSRNSIFIGSQGDEVSLWDGYQGSQPTEFDVLIENSIVRVEELLNYGNYPNFLTSNCPSCLDAINTDELFLDRDTFNFSLDTMSIARGLGLPIPGLDLDLTNYARDAAAPDAGCFEYKE
jgi:Right handed beta helix region